MNGSNHSGTCNSRTVHEDIVVAVKENIPSDQLLYELADFFKVFGDSTRIKILCALLSSEMCVCDLSVLLGMNQSAISHQLRVLKQANLVKYRRDGKAVYYSLRDEHVNEILQQGFTHLNESWPVLQEERI